MCMPGCADTPSLITKNSGDNDLAQLLETMRVKGRQTALAAAVIVDNKIMASAAVGTRKYGTENWVTVDDKFIIASCGKAFTATLAAVLVEEGLLSWAYDENYYTFWENGFGWPLTSANYALGWYVTKEKDGESLLHHGGTSRAFQAEVYVAPHKKKAILLATNSRMGHIHLYRTAVKINEKYALKIDLP
jgi:hypothetical protein